MDRLSAGVRERAKQFVLGRTASRAGSASRGRVRLAAAVAVVVGIGIVASLYGPKWLTYIGGLFAAALVSLLVTQYAPTVVERLSGDGPIQALIGADGAFYSDGWTVAMPHTLAPEERPQFQSRPSAEEVRSWFSQRGAYDGDASFLRLTLVGRSREPILINGMTARILAREPAAAGSIITYPSAGENQVIAVEFDLDREQPQATTDGEPYFADYSLALADREAQEMRIVARATAAAVQWELEIAYTWRGERHFLRLDNGGEPFRTTPVEDRPDRYVWQWWDESPSLASQEPPDRGHGQ